MNNDPALDTFYGDETFPVEWSSEAERSLFWVFDDLHCPRPISPIYYDIGGWWLTCDHMFRRFGTPFACDWLVKNVNGYVYTAAIPADPELDVSATEYGNRYAARVPADAEYPAKIGAYLGAVLPKYGLKFADWWRERLVPEMKSNYAYLEQRFADADSYDLAEAAIVLEDAIDIHDRHWKIHWMMNFAQLSATTGLEATAKKIKGDDVDPQLLARLQNSANDRNWDSIGELWKLKEAVKADYELKLAFEAGGASAIMAALKATEAGQRWIDELLTPYADEYGWHAVWSHEVQYPLVVEDPTPVLELVKGYVEQDYDYPSAREALRQDLKNASAELLSGLEGVELEELALADEVNRRMAPLTPDHHFYIDQGANSHLRMALIVVGRKLVAAGALDEADDVVWLRYQQLRYLIGDPAGFDARPIVTEAKRANEESLKIRPRDWVGTVTESQLNFPYWPLWGYPEKFYRGEQGGDGPLDKLEGIGGSPGVVEGVARVIDSVSDFDQVRSGDILVCQLTNPAWVVLFTKVAAVVTDTGGVASHPAVLSREFGIPAVVGTSVATAHIKSGDRVRVDGTNGIVEILAHEE